MECASRGKLDIDLHAGLALPVRMDLDTKDVITQLCTQAGMIMEDMIPAALTIGTLDDEEITAQLASFDADLVRAIHFIQAARAVCK